MTQVYIREIDRISAAENIDAERHNTRRDLSFKNRSEGMETELEESCRSFGQG